MYDAALMEPPIAPCRDYNPGPIWNRLTCEKGGTIGLSTKCAEYYYTGADGVLKGPFLASEICEELDIGTNWYLAKAMKHNGEIHIRGKTYHISRKIVERTI
jgi:hypothetical protein